MKKRLLAFGIMACVLTGWTAAARASDDNAFTKFGRGIGNILISPAEICMQPMLLAKDHDAPSAFFGGLFKGAVIFVAREVVGVYEVVTFPFPIPKDFRPIIEPANTFSDWSALQA